MTETASLMRLIDDMKAHLHKFEINSVFQIKVYDPNDVLNVTVLGDLYTDYSTITEDQVRDSILWCTQVLTASDMKKAFAQSLSWSEEHLLNSMSDDLRTRCLEKYRRFNTAARGGPLLFKIMMSLLLIDTREAANNLIAQLENHKLSNVRGEDVLQLTTVVGATVKRLEQMKDPITDRPCLPDDLNHTILGILQTTSTGKFNEIFEQIQLNAEVKAVGGANPIYPPVQELVDKAEAEYRRLVSKSAWLGINVQGQAHESAFSAGGSSDSGGQGGRGRGRGRGGRGRGRGRGRGSGGSSKPEPQCFNCGSKDHMLSDCPHDHNEEKIAAAEQAYKEALARARQGKFAPPTANEKRNKSQRLIDGKLFKWNTSTSRWDKVTGANITVPGAPQQPPRTQPPGAQLPPSSGQSVMSALTGQTGLTSEQTQHRDAAIASLREAFRVHGLPDIQ